MRNYLLIATILIAAALGWRFYITSDGDEKPPSDWCPAIPVCVPAEDVERFAIQPYATRQTALPTEFLMRIAPELAVRRNAVAVAIYPQSSAALDDYEVMQPGHKGMFDQVSYQGKFGNQHTWRAMARSHARRGGFFYRTDNLVYWCNEHEICNALIHTGMFEGSVFVDRKDIDRLPEIRDYILSIFGRWQTDRRQRES